MKYNKKNLKKAILFAIALVVFLFATNPALIPFTSDSFKEKAGDVWKSIFGDVDSVVGMFSLKWASLFKLVAVILLLAALNSLFKFIYSKITPRSGRGKSIHSLFSNGTSYLITIVGIFWALSIMGVNVTAIFAGVGILALVISFGAESLIEDIITGFFLVFDKQFNVGDIIEIDGFRGTVEQIGIRSTYICAPGGNVQIMNNSSIKKVLNRSAAPSVAATEVSIAYGADLEHAERVLAETMPLIRSKYPDVFPSDPQYLGVSSLGESGVVLKIIATVEEKNIYSAPRYMNREIKLAFDRCGVEIPFPQLVVHQAKDR